MGNAVGQRPQAFIMQPGAGMQQIAGRMMAPNGMAAEGQPPWVAASVNGNVQQVVSPAGEANIAAGKGGMQWPMGAPAGVFGFVPQPQQNQQPHPSMMMTSPAVVPQ